MHVKIKAPLIKNLIQFFLAILYLIIIKQSIGDPSIKISNVAKENDIVSTGTKIKVDYKM
ncbi:5189_t:CDS:2 [Entrophospora sp. SA101]|nr:5189_t:CDS:2 [Entrophospora sp. SA101]CAJ0895979.1 1922_t:CDS:2 [Entrophospora sp. SA101]CAJ0906724.1 8572_t:CDS:2 [Entrophospora sp. SA101]